MLITGETGTGKGLVASAIHPRTRLRPRQWSEALVRASGNGISLISAAACVGIVIGVVTLTGIGSRLPALILPLAQQHLLLALLALMISSIILGMGLPSAVCYLLLATMVGSVLGKLGVSALAAHLFIFYFGLMSMVTPPVALAAYAASSIAGSKFLQSSVAAFRFALMGFILPFLFIYRPALLMLTPNGEVARPAVISMAILISLLGLVPMAAALAGRWKGPMQAWKRILLAAAAVMVLFPGPAGWVLAAGLNATNILGGIAAGALLLPENRQAT